MNASQAIQGSLGRLFPVLEGAGMTEWRVRRKYKPKVRFPPKADTSSMSTVDHQEIDRAPNDLSRNMDQLIPVETDLATTLRIVRNRVCDSFGDPQRKVAGNDPDKAAMDYRVCTQRLIPRDSRQWRQPVLCLRKEVALEGVVGDCMPHQHEPQHFKRRQIQSTVPIATQQNCILSQA
jgi:hypothetical protein